MNNAKRVEIVREALENHNFLGVRGLPHPDNNKKYRKNQLLTKSYAHYDEGDIPLSGTSAIGITDYDDDDDIVRKIERAQKEYSEAGRVILIAGNDYLDGEDIDEMLIRNEVGFEYRGARYICDL